MSADLYMDREGDVWAVRGNGTAVCVISKGEPTGDLFGGAYPDFTVPWVEGKYGPLLRLEVPEDEPTPPPALADVLRAMGEEIHARVQVEANIHSGGDAYAVLNFLDGVFARAIRQAEGGAT